MLTLHTEKQQQQVIFNPVNVSRVITFTESQIDDLFEISGLFKSIKRRRHEKDVCRLQELQLSFEDCKTLFKNKQISIDHLESYINDLKLTVDQILFLRGQHNLFPYEVKSLLKLNITVGEVIALLKAKLYQDEIVELIKEKQQTPASILQLLKYISKEELIGLDKPTLIFIAKIKTICESKCDNITASLQCYESIYSSIPSSLIQDAIQSANKLLYNASAAGCPPPNNFSTSDAHLKSIEEILMFYMDLASGNIVKLAGYADLVSATFNSILKVLDRFSRSENIGIFKLFPIKPYLLAVIWIAMITQIVGRHLGIITFSMEEVARTGLATLFSLFTGVTGFFHSGGIGVGSVNVTSYIAAYYKMQKTIEEHCKGIYKKIPDILKFHTEDSFDKLAKEKQLSAGRALSMTYTFRIGDNMIAALADENEFSLRAAKKAFKSMWPLPMSAESKRMYFLYSGCPIYTSIDMTDVFVRVPSNFI